MNFQTEIWFAGADSNNPPAKNTKTVIPTTAATYYSGFMSEQFQQGYVYLGFYSDAAGTTPVTPTAGTAVVECSPDGGQTWLTAAGAASINATACGTSATYTVPAFAGLATRMRVTLAGITGAAYCSVRVWRGQ